MKKDKVSISVSEELLADLGYVKMYLKKMEEIRTKYPHTIQGPEQIFYLQKANELMEKASIKIGIEISKARGLKND
jgi:hypothetical protein